MKKIGTPSRQKIIFGRTQEKGHAIDLLSLIIKKIGLNMAIVTALVFVL